jgi:hypothetical protein
MKNKIHEMGQACSGNDVESQEMVGFTLIDTAYKVKRMILGYGMAVS